MEAGQIDANDHECLMSRMGGFYAALDPLIAAACESMGDDIAGYRYRPRLGLFPSRSRRPVLIPAVDTPAALAGAIYVVDGAVLGGQVLARAFGDRSLHPYWHWCCQNGPSVWRAAKALIDHLDTDAKARAAATRTALDMFDAFAGAVDMTAEKGVR